MNREREFKPQVKRLSKLLRHIVTMRENTLQEKQFARHVRKTEFPKLNVLTKRTPERK